MRKARRLIRSGRLAGTAVLALMVSASVAWSGPAPSDAARRKADAVTAQLAALSEKQDYSTARDVAEQASRSFAAEGEQALAAGFALETMKFDRDLQDWPRLEAEFLPRLEALIAVLDPEQDEDAYATLMDAEGFLGRRAEQ